MKTIWPFLAIAVLLAALAAPFASSFPDGLEWVAEKSGFYHHAAIEPPLSSPLPDYSIPGISNSILGTSLSGIIGTLICFLLPFGFSLLRRK
ncbi:MAG: PDGLE domain-containing protein [bacterium]|nr:PDGLE domain-containing protein [bacterium]